MKFSYDKNKLKIMFYFVSIASLILILLFSMKDYNYWQLGTDRFMDFFNSIRDAAVDGVYSERKVIYPPLINLFYKFMGIYMEQDYILSGFDARLNAYLFPNAMIVYMIYNIILVAGILIVLNNTIKLKRKYRYLIILFILLSNPFMYAFERGNSILIVLALIFIFYRYYYDGSIIKRELALLALAASINIKIYPVILSLILISNKDFKRFLRLGIYSAILFFSGFGFYGGMDGLEVYIKNIFRYSNNTYNQSIIGKSDIKSYLEMMTFINPVIKYLILLILFLGAIFVVFMANEQWQKWLACCWLMLNVPGVSLYYNWVFFSIPLVMFINDRFQKEYQWIFAVFIIMIYIYYPVEINGIQSYYYQCSLNLISSCGISGIIGIFIIVLFLDNAWRIFKQFKDRENKISPC